MTIEIRRASPDDAAALAALMADPAVFPGLLQMPYANAEAQRLRLADSLSPGKADLNLVALRGGELVGGSGLHPFGTAPRRRHAAMLGISVASAAQGQGVGRALMQAMCDYADRWMGVLRIELTVFADNEAAVALYGKFGFEIEGRLRAYALRDGVYADVLTMARLHPSPPAFAPA